MSGLFTEGAIGGRVSPAMAVALLALFVALGGSSYAAARLAKDSVVSRTIKDGQVKRADLAANAVGSSQVGNGSLRAADFARGERIAGPRGAQGNPGPKGDPGMSSLVVRVASGTGVVRANCLPGERATGGGAHSFTGFIQGSAPVLDPLIFYTTSTPGAGFTPTSWSAHAEDEIGHEVDVTVWVVCTSP